MAMIKCPECGADVSDKAATCPNCGAPLPKRGDGDARSQFKTGAIMGTIGGASVLAFLAFAASGQLSSGSSDGTTVAEVTVKPDVGGWVVVMVLLGFVLCSAATVLFVVALIRGGKMRRKAAMRLSAASIAISALGFFGLILFYGLIAICGGWLFLWEPLLEVVGAVKMYRGAAGYVE